MSKLRVYELAKEKNLSTRELMWIFNKLGIEVKSHMSTITAEELKRLEEYLQPKPKIEEQGNRTHPLRKNPESQASGINVNKKNVDKNSGGKSVSHKKNNPASHAKPKQTNNGVEQGGSNDKVNHGDNSQNAKQPGKKGLRQGGQTDLKKDHSEKTIAFAAHVKNYCDEDNDFGPKKQTIKKKAADEKKLFDARNKKKKQFKKNNQPAPKPEIQAIKKIVLGESVVVQDFAKKIGKTASDVIKKLIALGVMATVNQEIDFETAAIIAAEYGIEVDFKTDKPLTEIAEIEDDPATLKERPPVVTVMGHVDHGKTSLLDAIRLTNVTATEAGGITQHIGAYQVEVKKRKVTFLDTPGHEAFTAMRARGAQATDIAVLVVAADDGVMPQTVEAINHAKAANVPIIVAVNKIDKPEANPERVKQQLTEYGLVPEEWGGDTLFVPVSALKKEGINELLEVILLVAEMSELKANPNRLAAGVVIEAELDKGRGPVATVLVQKGTLRVGDIIVTGATYGKVRAMVDDKGHRIKEAGPSVPVEVLGLSAVPEAGEIFQVVEDEKLAKEVTNQRQIVKRQEELQQNNKISLDDLFKNINAGDLKELNIIVKADVQGSVEALKQSLERLNNEEVKVNIIHGGVGAITETDVMLASASKAIIIGFNVRPDANARRAAENEQVDIRIYRIIYEAIDSIKAAMSGLLEPELKETILGRAEVRAIFKVPKAGVVAGSYVVEGKITNKAKVRVIRDGIVIHEGEMDSLRRFKDDVKEVAQGFECGIGLARFNDLKEGDIIEAYTFEEIKRELK